MAVRPWLQRLRNSIVRDQRKRSRGRPVEHATGLQQLEDRSLLAASVLFSSGNLQILADASEAITVRENPNNPGRVQVLVDNSVSPSLPGLLTSQVTAINIVTGSGNNVIDVSAVTGTSFANITSISIDSGDGHDSITGSATYATAISGGDGDDTITGGAAADSLLGEDGNDVIVGNGGNDVIDGGDGADSVTGDDGDDTIIGGDGGDTLTGGLGNDSMAGNDGRDSIEGNEGNDTLVGDQGRDTIVGADGDDLIYGGGEADLITGGDGNDSVVGNAGNDTIDGGAGNDTLDGSGGRDSVLGGAASDLIIGGLGADTLDGQDGGDTVNGGGGDDLIYGDTPSIITATLGNDLLLGQSGNDTIIGGLGADTLLGGNGRDLLLSTFNEAPPTPPAPPQPPVPPPPVVSGPIEALTPATSTGAGGALTNPTTLTNGPGDGSITLGGFDAAGNLGFGSDTFDPIGPQGPTGGVIFDTSLFFRVGSTGPRTVLTSTNPITGNATEANSAFSNSGLDFALVQTVGPLDNTDASRVGSVLTQTYTITNPGTTAVGFELVRYQEAHAFNLSTTGFNDGGGLIRDPNGVEILFESGGLVTGTAPVHLIGITGVGGDPLTSNRLEFNRFGSIRFLIQQGGALSDQINGDTDGDELVDNPFFDAEVALRNVFTLAPGATTTYTTHTVFMTLFPTPPNVPPVAVNDNGTTFGGAPITVDVVSNDSDSDGVPDFSTVEIVSQPANGTAVNLGNGLVTYTPNPGFGGTDTFTYRLFDDDGSASNVATITIEVFPTDTIGDVMDGGDGRDTAIGALGNDLIVGGLEADNLNGRGGNDTIYGGAGNDTLNGDDGNDWLSGQGGQDLLNGGAGEDNLMWRGTGDGRDTLIGGDGGDNVEIRLSTAANIASVTQNASGQLTVTEGTAVVTVDETVSTASIFAGAGADQISVGDLSRVRLSSLRILGQDGADQVNLTGAVYGNVRVEVDGGNGNDTLIGGAANDRLLGGADNDSISGGGGNDLIFGNDGNDNIDAGAGNDTVDGGDGADTVAGGLGDDSLVGGLGSDVMDGGDGHDTLRGGFGNDILVGSNGNDSVDGGSGLDTLIGGAGADTLDGGRDDDMIRGNSGNDLIRGNHGNDSIDAGVGDDEISGGDGNDTVIAGDGNDGINGDDGNDLLIGDQGNDLIAGGDGDDTLIGGGGNDTLLGQEGIDILNGNGGTDTGAVGQGLDPAPISIEVIDESFRLTTQLLAKLDGV